MLQNKCLRTNVCGRLTCYKQRSRINFRRVNICLALKVNLKVQNVDKPDIVVDQVKQIVIFQEEYTVGKSDTSNLKISGSNVRDEHAKILIQGSRVKCVAVLGEGAKLLDPTFTWLEGTEMRNGVEYLVESGDKLTFGEEDQNVFVVEYEQKEGQSTAVMEMMMKGMAKSKEVQEALEKRKLSQ
eukprot:TRINITY_DN121_c0_g2_i1.p1 TRINITY_DN121_c0_g2~~TRINITY_DN121_c0_g2_i1.p1  ORF type:complete len:184 (+),score=28.07 TRINITY_DN121_c0_g2_i1:110-661(+)